MDRIKIIASKVEDNSKIIDIGCDHAYLDIELIEQNRNINVIASDISKNVISTTKEKLKKLGYNIDLRCGDGLDVVNSTEIDTIIISGMGSFNQIEILTKDISKLDNVKTIILCPNDSAFNIRNNLKKIGYYIYDEDIIYESKIYYPLLVLKKGIKNYSYSDILLGPILRNKNDINIKNYYKEQIEKKKSILSNLPEKYGKKIKELQNDIKILELKK